MESRREPMLLIGPQSGAPGSSMGLEVIKDLYTGISASNIVQTLFSAKNIGHMPGSEKNWALCLVAGAIPTQVSLPISYVW